ncbi:cation/H+ exchanger 18 [Actinidia rufa]|uniref:Cation/H+ exchanger 18 n=1 Tax=Actinidia rufa TaxID=165716 RepID=A0A7J0H020_9ERIC|nr:cation/H+ exchanger 18 [Actinidia rufa]
MSSNATAICLVVVLTRALALLLRPLRQPRVIAEIVGGILLGPSALGRNQTYLHKVFPPKSYTVLDTLANLGLLFFLFLVGLELDPKSLRRTGKKALGIALAGISLPFALGIGSAFVLRETISKGVSQAPFLVFMGVALSITAFPVLARILAELKLLTTDVGRVAMSAAAVNDLAAWILLALAIAISGTGHSPLVSLWVLLCGCMFVFFCVLVVPPVFKWMGKRYSEGEPVDEMYVCATLSAVLAAGFITDSIGIHASSGPFGLKTDITTIQGVQSWGLLALVICTACLGKNFGYRRGLTHVPCAVSGGSSSRVFNELERLSGAHRPQHRKRERGVKRSNFCHYGSDGFVHNLHHNTSLVVAVYKPAKNLGKAEYRQRAIQRKNTNTQLRIMACFHSTRNVPTLINIIEASRGTERRGKDYVYIMQSAQSRVGPTNDGNITDEQHARGHMRQCAERKRAAIIILPFHKHQRLDGQLETTRTDFRNVNRRVLEHAPCSVGILVDRGFGGTTQVSASNVDSVITVVFFGGPDDCESSFLWIDMDREEDEFLTGFKQKTTRDGPMKYEERVGPVPSDLNVNTECPELGPVGGLLTSSDFSTTASVLVVQQYRNQLSMHSLASLKEEDESPDKDADTS